MFHLWYERQMDEELAIETQDMREWTDLDDLLIYNRMESTPYQALDKLFEISELGSHSNFVDIGCGSGRVSFYVHNRFNVPVTGIELNTDTYHDLINNYHNYLKRSPQVDFEANIKAFKTIISRNSDEEVFKNNVQEQLNFKKNYSDVARNGGWSPINFVQEYAEKYLIQPEQNVFYFFNPFTISIFSKVVRNIEQSLFEHPRNAEIILYYPMHEYQSFMENKTIFKREGSINLNMLEDEFEKFIIYRY